MSGDRSQNIPRNSPCPCGSGKKYKKCCRSYEIQQKQHQPAAEVPRIPVFPMLAFQILRRKQRCSTPKKS